MATNNNTIKTRIQLKSDTEENWNKSVLTTDAPGIGLKTSGTSFVPLKGELIVYLEDTTHPFSRLKVGDGSTNVVNLPFIDGETIITTTTVGSIMSWDSGHMTEATVSNNILTINNGSKPVLSWMNKTVVNGVTKE